ncbi:MAG: DoxX family protein [Luteimonas sp.]
MGRSYEWLARGCVLSHIAASCDHPRQATNGRKVMNQATSQDFGKLVLRIILGALILLHGVSKLKNGLDPIEGMLVAHGLPALLAYGVLVGEVLAPVMLLFGFYARIGAILIAINMLFAFGMVHLGQLRQINAQGGWALELQGMFLFTAVAIALLGPGRYAINPR